MKYEKHEIKTQTKLVGTSAGIQSKLRSFSVLEFSLAAASRLANISSSLHFKFKAEENNKIDEQELTTKKQYIIGKMQHTNFLDSFTPSKIFTE